MERTKQSGWKKWKGGAPGSEMRTAKRRKCQSLPRDKFEFAKQVNERRKLVNVVGELMGRTQKDMQVKQKVLQQVLEMAYAGETAAKKEKQEGPDKLTWNLPPIREQGEMK